MEEEAIGLVMVGERAGLEELGEEVTPEVQWEEPE